MTLISCATCTWFDQMEKRVTLALNYATKQADTAIQARANADLYAIAGVRTEHERVFHGLHQPVNEPPW